MPKTTSFVLGEQLEAFIASQIQTGEYSNASEVVRDALRRLKRRRERDAYEARLIDEADASGICPETHEEIWAELHHINAARTP